MRLFLLCVLLVLAWSLAQPAAAVDPYAGNDPYWVLLHEPAVVKELKLTARQQPAFQQLLDELDLRFFPLRNKPQKEATAGMRRIIQEAREGLKTELTVTQNRRLLEIFLRKLGTAALLRDEVASRMKYSESQRKDLEQLIEETQTAVAAIEKEASEGQPRGPLEKKYAELKRKENQRIQELLKPEQRTFWKEMFGPAFDLAKVGRPAFKAPEIIDTGEWINSQSVRLSELQGKVVVVHFYAFGCINCIHNYPAYLEWQERFRDQDVVLLGIHTPETTSERELASVRKKAAEAKFIHPIVIDGKNENWNAWGNSMWPSVYVLDKRGYLRHFWPGELNWQGQTGEKFMREKIEELVQEKFE